jgi:hypothetical protein
VTRLALSERYIALQPNVRFWAQSDRHSSGGVFGGKYPTLKVARSSSESESMACASEIMSAVGSAQRLPNSYQIGAERKRTPF